MRKFPKIIAVACLAFCLFGCSKDIQSPSSNAHQIEALSENEDDYFTYEDTFLKEASSRGLCGTVGVEVTYEGKNEFEFDVAFSGWGNIHFFNTPSGTIRTRSSFPIMVQEQSIYLTNKPIAKKNPTCPWIGRPTGEINIKVMLVQKNKNGKWEQVPGSSSVSYILGSKAPSKVLMGGARVFCVDKSIGKWKMCNIY